MTLHLFELLSSELSPELLANCDNSRWGLSSFCCDVNLEASHCWSCHIADNATLTWTWSWVWNYCQTATVSICKFSCCWNCHQAGHAPMTWAAWVEFRITAEICKHLVAETSSIYQPADKATLTWAWVEFGTAKLQQQYWFANSILLKLSYSRECTFDVSLLLSSELPNCYNVNVQASRFWNCHLLEDDTHLTGVWDEFGITAEPQLHQFAKVINMEHLVAKLPRCSSCNAKCQRWYRSPACGGNGCQGKWT